MELLERKLFELENRIEDQSARLNDVATMGLMITSLVDIEQVLSAMMDMATRMVGGEVGCIMLQERDRLQTKISWGIDDRTINVDQARKRRRYRHLDVSHRRIHSHK